MGQFVVQVNWSWLAYLIYCLLLSDIVYILPSSPTFPWFSCSFLLAESETRMALPSFFHFNKSIFSPHNKKVQFLCFLLKERIFFSLKFCCCGNVKKTFMSPSAAHKRLFCHPLLLFLASRPRFSSSSSFFSQTYLSLHAQSSLPFLPKASYPGAGKLFNCSSEIGEISLVACWVVFGSFIMNYERFSDLLQVFCVFGWLTLQFFAAFSSWQPDVEPASEFSLTAQVRAAALKCLFTNLNLFPLT